MKLLEGKTALITGGSRGIGKAIAKEFALAGANVAFTCTALSEKALESEKELLSLGVKAKAYASDAANFDTAHVLVQDIISEFGQIDILVNNAGITRDTLLMRMNEAQWDEVIDTNLKSVFNMTHAITPVFVKQKKGSIINMSSVVGLSGNFGQTNYAASKAGIIGFTKSVAKELGSRGIRANVIAPGFIATEMTEVLSEEVKQKWTEQIPLRRIGKGEDVANVALFLASDMAAYVTGQVITVCGGMNM